MATYMPRLDKACISDLLTPRTMMKDEISSPTYPPCFVYVFPQVLWTTWWWPIRRAETCSCSYLMLLCFDWVYIYIYIHTHNMLCIMTGFLFFFIEKGSHFLRFSVITALSRVYWRLRPDCVLSLKYTELDDKAICHIVQHFQENLSQLERDSFPDMTWV
jgi:hypothetical protein